MMERIAWLCRLYDQVHKFPFKQVQKYSCSPLAYCLVQEYSCFLSQPQSRRRFPRFSFNAELKRTEPTKNASVLSDVKKLFSSRISVCLCRSAYWQKNYTIESNKLPNYWCMIEEYLKVFFLWRNGTHDTYVAYRSLVAIIRFAIHI